MRGLQREESPVRHLLQTAAQLPGAGGVDQFPVLRGEFKELGAGAGGSLEEDVTIPTRRLPLTIDLYEHAGETVEQRVHPYHSGEQLFRYALELHLALEHPLKERSVLAPLSPSFFGARALFPGRPAAEATLRPNRPLQLCGCLFEGHLVVLLEELLGVLATLPQPLVAVSEPGAGLLHHFVSYPHIEEATLPGDALAVHDVEEHLLERRGHLVFADRYLRLITHRLVTGLELPDPTHV